MNTGQAMPIPPGEFTVGRLDESYVRVDDPSVSRSHAKLFNGGEGLFVLDAGSSNGTSLRGTLIKDRTKLNLGDIVYIGSVPFRIDPEIAEGGNQTASLPPLVSVKPGGMHRATERIPAVGELPRVVEEIAPDKLSAPEVNPADSDADELNAVVIREPAPLVPEPLSPSAVEPDVAPAPTPIPKAKKHSVRISVSVPAPQESLKVARYPSAQEEVKAAPRIAVQPAGTVAVPRVPVPLTPQASLSPRTGPPTAHKVVENKWKTLLPTFLVGLGIGLFIGFVMAWFLFRNG